MSKADPAELFGALGDPRRLAIVERLADGKARAIRDLGEGAGVTRQALTKHLKVLEHAGVLRSERVGREVRYAIEQRELARAEAFLAHVRRQWSDALVRLKEHVER